jgi:hypothetical protein
MSHSIPVREQIVISLGEDAIYTNATGIKQLMTFYHKALAYDNCTIHISLDNLTWLDGNLCALFGALIFQLGKERGITFTIDGAEVSRKCNILFRNEFLPLTNIGKESKASCIPFRSFYATQKDEFVAYLTDDLLVHKGMPEFTEAIKDKLIDDLTELSGNIDKHAETQDPFFVCGQFFPKFQKVVFTVSDVGAGFLPKINLKQPEIVKDSADAILWALKGNSTKDDAPGGTNLKRMKEYFMASNGGIQIITGDASWNSELIENQLYPNGIIKLPNECRGTTINLIFNKNNLS